MNLKTENNSATEVTDATCPLWRRFGSIVYDTILLACVIFLAWQPVPLLPEFVYPAIGRVIRLGYLTAICFLFFGWFWCHGGQTLGMRAWRVKLITAQSSNLAGVTWRIAWIRFISSLLSWAVIGVGFTWSLFHRNKATWHDILSGTKLIVVSRGKKATRSRH